MVKCPVRDIGILIIKIEIFCRFRIAISTFGSTEVLLIANGVQRTVKVSVQQARCSCLLGLKVWGFARGSRDAHGQGFALVPCARLEMVHRVWG